MQRSVFKYLMITCGRKAGKSNFHYSFHIYCCLFVPLKINHNCLNFLILNKNLLVSIFMLLPADQDEHRCLEKALELIKHTISQVNTQVSECEKTARVREISYRLEPRTQVRLKDGRCFRREELIQGNKTLLHEGPLTWKASGKQKGLWWNLVSVSASQGASAHLPIISEYTSWGVTFVWTGVILNYQMSFSWVYFSKILGACFKCYVSSITCSCRSYLYLLIVC